MSLQELYEALGEGKSKQEVFAIYKQLPNAKHNIVAFCNNQKNLEQNYGVLYTECQRLVRIGLQNEKIEKKEFAKPEKEERYTQTPLGEQGTTRKKQNRTNTAKKKAEAEAEAEAKAKEEAEAKAKEEAEAKAKEEAEANQQAISTDEMLSEDKKK